MAVRNIVKTGDEILLKVSRPVTEFDQKLHDLLDDMRETMRQAEGCGLAAVQVGLLRRVCVIDVGEGVIELVNPEIITARGKQEEVEGCLSSPGDYAITRRPKFVRVKAVDRNNRPVTISGEGLLARALCHEIDHLDGILFRTKVVRECEK